MSNQKSRLTKIEKSIEPYLQKNDTADCIIMVKPDATDEEIEAEAEKIRQQDDGYRSGIGPEFIVIYDYGNPNFPQKTHFEK